MTDEQNVDDEIENALVEVPADEVKVLLESGYLLMEMGKNKEAEEVFSGVCALLPQSDVARVALGNLHFSQGRIPRALKFHQEALKLQPESSLANAHVGECLLMSGKIDQGLSALQKAKNLEPDSAAAAFAQALLEAHEAGELR
ncbi:MAG: tetratricopeptide repeat protein [Deltaproteobacteria bacterium]|nr:tetratricopeptide repeat protein [Deltaproteobacteria bacterium]